MVRPDSFGSLKGKANTFPTKPIFNEIERKFLYTFILIKHEGEIEMRKLLLCLFNLLLLSTFSFAENATNHAGDITGFWKTINEKTSKPESIIGIYKYEGKYYGRIILTYLEDGAVQDTIENPKKRALGVSGNPYYVGLDILWDLQLKGKKYRSGSILDPEKGNIYGAEAWRNGEMLVVRGKLLVFGRNQTWPPAVDSDFPVGFKKPDLKTFVPAIPKTI